MEATVQGASGVQARCGGVPQDTDSERRLWLAVVAQAVEEWRNGTLRNKRLAQHFLFDDTCDFFAVCGHAGLDAENLRTRLLKIGRKVNAAGPWPHRIAA